MTASGWAFFFLISLFALICYFDQVPAGERNAVLEFPLVFAACFSLISAFAKSGEKSR